MRAARGPAVTLAAAVVVVLGAGSVRVSQPAPEVTVLTIHHSRFSAGALRFAPGTTVRFVIRNKDPIAHELIVGDAMVQLRHERGTEAHHGARPGEVSVAAGAEAKTTFVFGAPGRLMFGCHLPGHWAYGMHGVIEITP